MAPTPQPTLTREQQQALAKARARARISAGAGLGPTNPMVAQGQAAQQQWREAGSKPANPNPENPIITAQRSSQTQAMGDWAQQREAERQAEAARAKARRESAAAFGGGMDLMPTEDEAGNVRPGTDVDTDISKGIITAPLQFGQGLGEGVTNMANVGFAASTGLYNAGANLIDPQREQVQPYKLEFPRNEFLEGPGGSVSGMVPRIAGQVMSARVPIGKALPGGGFGAEVAKDAMAVGLGTPQDAPRLSDMIDSGTPVIGGVADFLKTKPGDNALTAASKNAAEDLLIGGGIGAVLRGGVKVIDSVGSRAPLPATNAGGTAVRLASQAPAATPQSVPVSEAPIPQAAPRAAQARPSGAGQGAGAAGPAVTPAAGQGAGVLNAAPAAVGQSPVAMAKSDARIIGRLLKAGGVARNDVNNLLAGLVQAYQSSNSSRLPLAFFAEEYLPTVLPKQTADDVIQKLRGFGRERYSANGPKDTSRSTMRNTVDTLRSTQQDNLSGVMDANLYKGKLIGQEDKLNAQLEQNARTAYTTALENANNRLLSGRATQEERDALGEIQGLLHNGAFLKEVPAHMRIKAMRDGINLEDFVQKDPIAAAHWLQSELRQAVSAAEGVGGTATSESRLYNEMRTTLLEQLEKVVPGYRGARKAHGDIYGAKEAIDFGGNFFKAARSEVETARLARQFKALSTRQKTAATMSIRDALKNEFRNKAEDTAAKVTRLQQAGVLDALETVLGADGKRVADAIRATAKENERIRAVDMMSGSNTADNLAQMEAAQEAVRSPINKAIGSLGDNRSWAATLTGDALLAVNGLPPLLTGGKIATSAVGKLGKPSAQKLSSATKTLYDLPAQPNALAPPAKSPRASAPRRPKPTPEQKQATLDELLRQYDALDHRANPAAGEKLLRQINSLKKQLAPPPSSPPVKAGFFGGSKPPLDMSEAARMQRAREQGFDVDTPLYHGTASNFEAFDKAMRGKVFKDGDARQAFFFSTNPKVASGYADEAAYSASIDKRNANPAYQKARQEWKDTLGKKNWLGQVRVEDAGKAFRNLKDIEKSIDMSEGAAVLPVFARLRNPYVVDSIRSYDNVAFREAIDYARQQGHDGVIFKNVRDEVGKGGVGPSDVYAIFDPENIRGKFAAFDPSQSGSSKLLSGLGASPEALGAVAGGITGYIANPTDANGDGVIDDQDRGLNAMGWLVSGGLGVKGARMGGGVIGNALKRSTAPRALEPLELSKANRVYAPGKPDDLGFITSAEYVLANPPARFRDAKALTADQWRKLMREGGASGESFKWQIEPALKRLADEGVTGDIPKARFEEALARTRGTLGLPPTTKTVRHKLSGRDVDLPGEAQYGEYVAPGAHGSYKQHVLLLPDIQGQGYKSHNWRSENPVGHIRTTTRTSANGEKVLHVEELQSDLHQEGAKYGYRDEVPNIEDLQWQQSAANQKFEQWMASQPARPSIRAGGADHDLLPPDMYSGDFATKTVLPQIKDPVGRELFRNAMAASDRTKAAARQSSNAPPRAPLENWEEPFIRYALKQGADQGVDVVTFPRWDTLHEALRNEGTQKFYDGRLPQHLASVAKSLGLKVEEVPIKFGSGVAKRAEWRIIPVPDGAKIQFRMGQGRPWESLDERFVSVRDAQTRFEYLKRSDKLHPEIDGTGTVSVPAIRLTPEAKQRLSEGIIMDAKDPGRRAPAKRPPPAQAGFGGSSGQGGKGPPGNALKVGRGVVEQVERAAKTVSPEVKNRLAANARLPYGQRKTAMEAAGDDPSLYRMAAPYQGAGRKKPTALDLGIEQGVKRAATLPKDVSLNPLLNAVEVTRKASSAAQRAETAAYKAGKIKEPGHPLVQTRIHAERAARDAKQKLLDASLEAIGREEAINQVNRRVSEIADELMKGPQAGPVARLPKPAPWHKNGRRGDLPKPKSRREADEMARLLFDEEYADILSKALDGTLPLKARTPAHYVLSLAAAGAGTAGIAAMAYDLKKRGEESMRKNGLLPAIEPPKDPRRQFNWEERSKDREVVRSIQIALNNIDPTYELAEDGLYYTNSRRNPSRTEQAVRFWQHENGFEATGEVTDEQMRMLYQMGEEARRNRNAARASGRPANALAPAQLQ